MRKATILAVAMLSLSASLALAAEGVNLYVGDCGGGSTINTVTNTCLTNSGTAFAAFGSMVMPVATRTMFVGAMSIMDVQNNGSAIDDWWRVDVCRGAGFTLQTDGGLGGTCGTLWDTVAPAGNNIYGDAAAEGAPVNRMRFKLGVVLDAANAYDLVGDGATEVSVFKFSVLKGKTVGAGACAGCLNGACIVLNEIQLQGLNDVTEADYMHITAAAANNHITYNAAAGIPVCPDAVPVRNRTWGSVKALYR